MILPSSLVTREAQLHILSKTACSIYVRTEDMAAIVDDLAQHKPDLQTITAPQISELMQDAPADIFPYAKSWKDGKDDPWLVFHTSGTTG